MSDWNINRSSISLRLRPVLECRMPTLATKPAFFLSLDEMPVPRKKIHGLQRLDYNPPRSLKDLRNIISSELKNVGKKLSRLERSYYGVGRSVQDEVEKYGSPLKGVMRMLSIVEFSSARCIEDAIKAGMDPKRYKGDPNNITMLKDVFTKVQQYVPDKFAEISDYCLKILSTVEKYFVSFYDAERDGYLETSAHYQQQINSWKINIRQSLEKVKKLQKDFKERIIHYSMFTPPVVAFCKKNECEQIPFLLMFADACTNIRAAMTVMTSWLQADENYPLFLRNDIDDMEHKKEEKLKLMRDAKTKYHSSTYKLSQTEIEYSKLRSEVDSWRDKEEALRIEMDYLQTINGELRQELDFKEFRRDELMKKKSEFTADDYNETYDMLMDEIRHARERQPLVKRQLAAAQHKLEWMSEKRGTVNKVEKELKHIRQELKDTKKEMQVREKEFTELELALEIARRIHRYKTSTDAAEKIYFCLPIGQKQQAVGVIDDQLTKVCSVVSRMIDQDWMLMYRKLPFHPKRGSETMENDIHAINIESARGPKEGRAMNALNRWRRYHTRAKEDDLISTIKKLKRNDIIHEIDRAMNPPKIVEEIQEIYVPPNVAPELIPFYKEIERYDQLKKANKIKR